MLNLLLLPLYYIVTEIIMDSMIGCVFWVLVATTVNKVYIGAMKAYDLYNSAITFAVCYFTFRDFLTEFVCISSAPMAQECLRLKKKKEQAACYFDVTLGNFSLESPLF